jgi:hypothetical protein
MITNDQRYKILELFKNTVDSNIEWLKVLAGQEDMSNIDTVLQNVDEAHQAFINYINNEL